jgi:hypothetical protein
MVAAQSRTALLKVSFDSTSWGEGGGGDGGGGGGGGGEVLRMTSDGTKQEEHTSHVASSTGRMQCTSPVSL